MIVNWRPVSLLNVDLMIFSKAVASRLRACLDTIISSEQCVYVERRFISQNGRLIYDILEACEFFEFEGDLVAVDIQKPFASINHCFLQSVFKKYGFGENFIHIVKTLLKNQESCVINGGKTTKYFPLQRGARQGDPVSAYLFILVLEVVFCLTKSSHKINDLEIEELMFLYSAYADDATFFVGDLDSASEILKVFNMFSIYSGLKPNMKKCEIAGIGSLKGVKVALCEVNSIDRAQEMIKILGLHFSYNKKLREEKNFVSQIKLIENLLKTCKMRTLSIEGKINIFKALAISKIVHLAMIIDVPSDIVQILLKMQDTFLLGDKPKIEHDTLCMDYSKGGLKKCEIVLKVQSLKLSWVSRLYDESKHAWKKLPNFFIHNFVGKEFQFQRNSIMHKFFLEKFTNFYKSLFQQWSITFNSDLKAASCIASQQLWYNRFITINNKTVLFPKWSKS